MEALQARKKAIVARIGALEAELRTQEAQEVKDRENLERLQASHKHEVTLAAHLAKETRQEDQHVIRSDAAKYLIGENGLDSGSLNLFWDRLVFSGWRGNVALPLAEISEVAMGRSRLEKWAGVPFLEKRLRGKDVGGLTLLLDLRDASGRASRAVIGGLREEGWPSVVERTKGALPDASAARATTERSVRSAVERQNLLEGQIERVQEARRQIRARADGTRSSIRALRDEMALPDWQHKSVQLKGRNLAQQLERTLLSESAQGWELVSTASPRKDEMVVALRRVRRS